MYKSIPRDQYGVFVELVANSPEGLTAAELARRVHPSPVPRALADCLRALVAERQLESMRDKDGRTLRYHRVASAVAPVDAPALDPQRASGSPPVAAAPAEPSGPPAPTESPAADAARSTPASAPRALAGEGAESGGDNRPVGARPTSEPAACIAPQARTSAEEVPAEEKTEAPPAPAAPSSGAVPEVGASGSPAAELPPPPPVPTDTIAAVPTPEAPPSVPPPPPQGQPGERATDGTRDAAGADQRDAVGADACQDVPNAANLPDPPPPRCELPNATAPVGAAAEPSPAQATVAREAQPEHEAEDSGRSPAAPIPDRAPAAVGDTANTQPAVTVTGEPSEPAAAAVPRPSRGRVRFSLIAGAVVLVAAVAWHVQRAGTPPESSAMPAASLPRPTPASAPAQAPAPSLPTVTYPTPALDPVRAAEPAGVPAGLPPGASAEAPGGATTVPGAGASGNQQARSHPAHPGSDPGSDPGASALAARPHPPFPTAPGAYVLREGRWERLPRNNAHIVDPNAAPGQDLLARVQRWRAAGVIPGATDLAGAVLFDGYEPVPIVEGGDVLFVVVASASAAGAPGVASVIGAEAPAALLPAQTLPDGSRYLARWDERTSAAQPAAPLRLTIGSATGGITLLGCPTPLAPGGYALRHAGGLFELLVR